MKRFLLVAAGFFIFYSYSVRAAEIFDPALATKISFDTGSLIAAANNRILDWQLSDSSLMLSKGLLAGTPLTTIEVANTRYHFELNSRTTLLFDSVTPEGITREKLLKVGDLKEEA
jgi:hypothetical protein